MYLPCTLSFVSCVLSLWYGEESAAAELQGSAKPHSIFCHFLFLFQPFLWLQQEPTEAAPSSVMEEEPDLSLSFL